MQIMKIGTTNMCIYINKTNISKSSIYRMMDNKEKDFYFLWK